MSRIRRAWAVLRGRNDPELAAHKIMLAARTEGLASADLNLNRYEALVASLRASLDDARAEVTRLSAQAKRRDVLVRQAHALLGTAITDDGVPQP